MAPLSAASAQGEPDPPEAGQQVPGDAEETALTEEELERARNHFMAGTAYYEDGRWQDAAREFQEAYRITGHPDVLYNLGQAHDRMDRREEAVEAYRGYLDRAEAPPDRERVERRIRELEQLMGAAEEDGLPPVSSQPTPAPPATPPGPAPEEVGFGPWPWVAIGAAGAMAVTAAITGGLALSRHGQLEDDCGPDGRSCPPGSQDDIDAGNALATWSTVLTIGAVLAAGAGVTLLIIDAQGGGEEAPPVAQVELLPGPTPAGATARVRF